MVTLVAMRNVFKLMGTRVIKGEFSQCTPHVTNSYR
jgi:hypothetical protein